MTEKKLSLVITVFNSEEYLAEAIDSVIDQSIGFRDNISLILVDDGSTDGSEIICRDYQNRYPDNIKYIKKENGGVSSARNAGIEAAEGRYLAFLDSDDTWDKDAFKNALCYFDEHYDEVDMVSTRIRIFGDRSYEHPMNFKYEDTRIIDLDKEPHLIQTTGGNVIFKLEAVKDRRYDENVRIHEDILFNTLFLLEKRRYGVISDGVYNYRKIENSGSLSIGLRTDPYWYTDIPEKVYLPIIERSKELYGHVDDYAQEVLLYTIKWRLKVPSAKSLLSEEEFNRFIKLMKITVSNIDDDKIMAMKGIPVIYKADLLGFKHDCCVFEEGAVSKNGKITFGCREGDKPVTVYNLCGLGIAKITNIKETPDKLVITGTSSCRPSGLDCELHAEDQDQKAVSMITLHIEEDDVYSFYGEKILEGLGFEISLDKKKRESVRIYTTIGGSDQKYYAKLSRSNDMVLWEDEDGENLKIDDTKKFSVVLKEKKCLEFTRKGLF